ncbi:MAG TPA: aspartyl/asparaginyl beta-hydroxylase domain-containing protein [Caulobacteraceae bacterium]
MGEAESADVKGRADALLRAGEAKAALALLVVLEADDLTPELFLDKALALRMLGDLAAAIEALDAALVLDPRNFLALLSKGALLERLGRSKEAVVVYKAAIAVAPPADVVPPGLAAPLARAKAAVKAFSDALAAHLMASVAESRSHYAGEDLGRFDESLEIFAGRARAFVQEPLLLHYPRLPAIPFYDRTYFPWLGDLEAATADIRGEFEAAQATRLDDFAPYIAFPAGAPVNQWGELNHSRRWSSLFLWRDGVRQEATCALCPRTAAVLASLPMADQPGFAPTAMFSVLEPRTRIPAHTGSANTRLIVHLPLVLPGPARFRVGAVTRPWRIGEAWVFDDTIEHEAWNDADEPRAILILDVWNPLLSEAERMLVSAMMTAKNAFQSEG